MPRADAAVIDAEVNSFLVALIEKSSGTGTKIKAGDILSEEGLHICRSIITKIQRRISATLERRNEQAKVQQLPKEILVTILDLSLPIVEPHVLCSYYYNLRRCRLVCRAWNSLIISHAGFWTLLSFDDPPNVRAMALEHSKDAPLTITSLTSYTRYGQGERISFDAILPHLHRCRTLMAVLDLNILDTLAATSPTIRRLSLVSRGQGYYLDARLLYQDQETPELEDVSLDGVAGLTPAPFLMQLKKLALDNAFVEYHALLGILSSSPDLVELSLRNLQINMQVAIVDEGEPEDIQTYRHLPKVYLQNLLVLSLQLSYRELADILSRLVTRRLVETAFYISPSTASTVPWIPNSPLYNYVIQAVSTFCSLSSKRVSSVILSHCGFGCIGPAFSFILDGPWLGFDTYRGILEGLPPAMFRSAKSIDIAIEIGSGYDVIDYINKVTPNVHRMRLTYKQCLYQDALSRLSRAVKDAPEGSPGGVWLLPKLRTLELYSSPMSSSPEQPSGALVRLLRRLVNLANGRKRAAKQPSAPVDRLEMVQLPANLDLTGKGRALLKELVNAGVVVSSSLVID